MKNVDSILFCFSVYGIDCCQEKDFIYLFMYFCTMLKCHKMKKIPTQFHSCQTFVLDYFIILELIPEFWPKTYFVGLNLWPFKSNQSIPPFKRTFVPNNNKCSRQALRTCDVTFRRMKQTDTRFRWPWVLTYKI